MMVTEITKGTVFKKLPDLLVINACWSNFTPVGLSHLNTIDNEAVGRLTLMLTCIKQQESLLH